MKFNVSHDFQDPPWWKHVGITVLPRPPLAIWSVTRRLYQLSWPAKDGCVSSIGQKTRRARKAYFCELSVTQWKK